MSASACIVNNIDRQVPIYWCTPVDLNDEQRRRASLCIERVSAKTGEETHFDCEHEMMIIAKRSIIPNWLEADNWERSMLAML